jgi:hypothetical protein
MRAIMMKGYAARRKLRAPNQFMAADMTKCSEAEDAAIAESGPLLRFASERVENLDSALSLAIAEARIARDNEQWSAEASQKFWFAFAKLCDLIKPVTMDCISAAHRNIEQRLWWSGKGVAKCSLAERSSRRYFLVLFMLLAIILPVQLYVWMCTNVSKKIDDMVSSVNQKITQTANEFQQIVSSTRIPEADGSPHKYTKEENLQVDKINAETSFIDSSVDRIVAEINILRRISMLALFGTGNVEIPRIKESNWYLEHENAKARFNEAQSAALRIQEASSLWVGVLGSFVLPIVFGAIGAVAFVIRSISEQMRTATFSQNSPIRHLMRVALGALAGVVVGLFNGLSNQLSLPPLAIAFLGGYGVEALFSMFDSLIDKFRQAK